MFTDYFHRFDERFLIETWLSEDCLAEAGARKVYKRLLMGKVVSEVVTFY